jgi:hypothetical protein
MIGRAFMSALVLLVCLIIDARLAHGAAAPVPCADLARLSLSNATVTAAEEIVAGEWAAPAGQRQTNLPPWVVDTRTDKVVNRIQLVNELSVDPTPDLLSVSPDGSHVFMSLRGPIPLTADPHVSTGSTPGVGVLKVLQGGRSAAFEYIARVSNVDAAGAERADVHASTVRLKVTKKKS